MLVNVETWQALSAASSAESGGIEGPRRSQPRDVHLPLVVAVRVGVMLARFFGVSRRVDVVSVRDVRVVAGLVMIPGFMVLGGRSMVLCGVFVVFGGLAVVLSGFHRHSYTTSDQRYSHRLSIE